MALEFFKSLTSFRAYIKKQLYNGEAPITYVSGEDKNGFIILEVMFRKTKEKSKFLYKDLYWYTVPDMEQLNRSDLHDWLESIRKKWRDGFYEAVRQPNTVLFITDDT